MMMMISGLGLEVPRHKVVEREMCKRVSTTRLILFGDDNTLLI